MSRLCLVGVGLPAFVAGREHAGPGLRSAHFAVAAARAGHEVLLVCVLPETRALEPAFVHAPVASVGGLRAAAIRTVFAHEKGFPHSPLREQIEAFDPQALVGVTAYGASVALRIGLQVPMWADVFGDLMAEAQAKSLAAGSDACLVHFWSLLAPVLNRADRFSAVSTAQAHALVGQLGLCGRLSAATAGENFVRVIPCSAEPPSPELHGVGRFRLRGEVVPQDARIVLWSGGFNTWCDVDTFARGIELAMDADVSLHLVVTGGSIGGHDERTYERFRSLVERSRNVARVHLLGWIESDGLVGCYADADLGIIVERDLYERRHGSENRAVHWMAHGLPFATTALSEFGGYACAAGCAFAIEAGSPASLSETLGAVFAHPSALASASARCRELAGREFSYASAKPFLDWAASPIKAGDHGCERPLRPGLLSEPEALADVLEAYLAGLSLMELGRRSTRWLWRRVLGIGAYGAHG